MNINDIPFSPKYTKDEVHLAEQWLRDNVHTFRGTANFGVLEDGKILPFTRQSCHREIANRVGKGRSLVATEIGSARAMREARPEVTVPFLKWFLHDSPYARFILTKDLAPAITYGIVVSTDVAAPLLQNIMIISRHFYEVSDAAFLKFNELTGNGCDPMAAYPLCFNTTFSNPLTKGNHLVQSWHNHRAHPLFNLKAFKNWMQGELGTQTTFTFDKEREHYRNNNKYTGGTLFFFDRPDVVTPHEYDHDGKHFLYDLVFNNKEFRDALSAHRGSSETVKYSPPNPFAPRVAGPKPHEISFSELWEFALPWCLKNEVFLRNDEGVTTNG